MFTARSSISHNLVMDYHYTTLTKNKNHQRAVSCISPEIDAILKAGNTRSRCMAGLWVGDIHRGLLWRPYSPQAIGCNYGVPSWSWLAFSSPVQWSWRHDDTAPELRILGSHPPLPRSFDPTWTPTSLKVLGVKLEVVVKGLDDSSVDTEGRPCA